MPPHPSTYNFFHALQYWLLPAPMCYTPTHAPAYWVDTDYSTGTIKRFPSPPPFPLQKAVINAMYEIDSLMVAPGVLLMRTPKMDDFRPWFNSVDFEQIFGHRVLGVGPNFPLAYIPDSIIIATNVHSQDASWEPSEFTKKRWAIQSKYPWGQPLKEDL